MEVKDILRKIRQREPQSAESFLALLLDEGVVKSAVWQVTEGAVKILALGENQIWEKEEDIIKVVDASIPEINPEPKKIIFGLPPAWVKENKIAVEKLAILKKISQQLELSPVGFVVASEALVYHLKTTEGVPPTAILVGITGKDLKVTLVKLGRIVGNQRVNRSDNLGADLAEGLSRFGPQEVFPARILLYNSGENLESARQELMAYSWPEQGVNFLHLPRVEILPDDFDIKAIALAGGREVTQIQGIEMKSLPPAMPLVVETPPVTEEVVDEEDMVGFLKEEDIAQKTLVMPAEKPKQFAPKLPVWRLPSLPSRPNLGANFPVAAVIAGLIVLVISLLAVWWYWPSAEIILAVKSQPLEKSLLVNIDPALAAIDVQSQTLPGRPLKKTISGEKTTAVTGAKIVGERASGKVIIYNRTTKAKVFTAGTQVLGPGGLKFTLSGEVSVASASAGPDYTSLPGKAEVKIEAVDIGTESNLASGTEFSFAVLSRSDFVARNEEALSGGTSREITVVAKTDQDALLAGLSEESKSKAVAELSDLAPAGQKVIPESLTTAVLEKNFDHEVGQEATELKLALKSEFSILTYDPQELKNLIEDKIKELIPAGFEYRDQGEAMAFSLKNVTKDGVAIFNLDIKTQLIPQLDLGNIGKNIAGKRPDWVQQYFTNQPEIEGAAIKIRPAWLGPLATLPHVVKKIKIEIRTN